MRNDHVDRPRLAHHLGRHQLRAGVRDPIRNQHEPRVLAEPRPAERVLVVIDPDGEAISERLDERARALLEVLTGRKRHVDHRHPALGRRGRQVPGLLDEHHFHAVVLTPVPLWRPPNRPSAAMSARLSCAAHAEPARQAPEGRAGDGEAGAAGRQGAAAGVRREASRTGEADLRRGAAAPGGVRGARNRAGR